MEDAGNVREAMRAYVRAVKEGSFPVDDVHGW
jgi:3-methyl-2-oxobutanoate hydroxymethyltransferase